MSEIKKKIEQRWLIKIEEFKDTKKIDELNNIIETSFKYAMEKSDFRFSHYDNFQEDLKSFIDNGDKIFVAKYMNKIVGTIAMKFDEIDKWYHTGKIVVLCHLAVLPKYHGRSIGKMLVKAVMDEANKLDLPIVFCTPEKNVDTIRFYENLGARKIRFYCVYDDHYAVKFVFFKNDEFSKEYCKEAYTNSAFNSLMKTLNVKSEVADKEIKDKWESDFLPFIKDDDEEALLLKRKCFLRYGLTPKEFDMYKLANSTIKKRRNHLSEKTTKSFYSKYENNELDKTNFPTLVEQSKEITELAPDYDINVTIITYNENYIVTPTFSIISLDNKSNKFLANINIATGTTALIKDSNGEQVMPRLHLPDWEKLINLVTENANKIQNGFIGWQAKHTENGWVIIDATDKPSFKNIQLAKRRGIRNDLEELLKTEIDTHIIL